ncbi:MAG: dethiobiotin synthase [Sedimenticola sp.]|nr:dethiobiotin synthase [Sedimenticola sp.]
MAGYFVTGTDTDCGKTLASVALMQALQARGERVLGMKPVAAGADLTPAGPRNDDALKLQAQGSSPQPYETVNPYLFLPPIAPHLAARQAGVTIDFGHIAACYRQLENHADRVVVEGAGGWRVPLGPEGGIAELALHLELPVILVVGLKLGCINHALLSAESILASGATLGGWIASRVDPDMALAQENIETLRQQLPCPCLGTIPHLQVPLAASATKYLRLPADQ